MSSIKKEFNRVENLLMDGRYNEAHQIIDTLQRNKNLLPIDNLKCQVLRANILTNQKYFDEAIKVIEQALNEIKKANSPLLQVDAYNVKIKALSGLNQSDEALIIVEQCDKLLTHLSQIQNVPFSKEEGHHQLSPSKLKSCKANLLNHKGLVYLSQDKIEQALQYFEQSLVINQEIRNNKAIAKVFHNMGKAFYLKGVYDLALTSYQQSLAFTEKIDKKGLGENYYGIGSAYMRKGELNQALEYLNQSLCLYEELRDKISIINVLNNIGNTYWYQGELDRAMDYHQRCLHFRKELHDKIGLAKSLNNLGLIYMRKGELNQALKYFQDSLTILEGISKKSYIASALMNIGETFSQKGELKSAFEYFQQALALFEEIGSKRDISNTLQNIGHLYWRQGEFNKAIEYIEQGLLIAREMNYTYNIAQTLFSLILLHKKRLDEEPKDTTKNSLKRLSSYLTELNQIYENDSTRISSQWYRLAKAIVLRISKEKIKVQEAEQIYYEILQEDLSYDLKIHVQNNLCEILFERFVNIGEMSILEDLHQRIEKILELLLNKDFRKTIYILRLLQGKIALLRQDIPQAYKIFQALKNQAHEKGFKDYEDQCDKELEKVKVASRVDMILEKQSHEKQQFQQQLTQEILHLLKSVVLQLYSN